MESGILQNIYGKYLILDSLNDLSEDDYELFMIMNNQIECLLGIQFRSEDNVDRYYYIVEDYTALNELAEQKKLTSHYIGDLVVSLLKLFCSIDIYLLDASSIMLSLDKIFYDPQCAIFDFVYCPGYHDDITSQVRQLAEDLLKVTDHQDKQAVVLAYGFYNLVYETDYFVEKLEKFVEDHQLRLINTDHQPKESQRMEAGLFRPKDEHYIHQNRYINENCGYMMGQDEEFNAEKNKNTLSKTISGNKAKSQSDKHGIRIDKEGKKNNRDEVLQISKDLSDKEQGLKGSVSGKKRIIAGCLWIIDLLLILLVVAIARYLFQVSYTMMAGITGLGLTVIIITRTVASRDKEEDFWSSDLHKDSKRFSGESDGTSLLSIGYGENNGEARLLKSDAKSLVLYSMDINQYENIYVKGLPCILGKDVMEKAHRIENPTISRRHARLSRDEKNIYITDLRSSNGTYVNQTRIEELVPHRIEDGDMICLSNQVYKISLSEE